MVSRPYRRIGNRDDFEDDGDSRTRFGSLEETRTGMCASVSTVQEKAVAYLMETKLLNRVRERLVKREQKMNKVYSGTTCLGGLAFPGSLIMAIH